MTLQKNKQLIIGIGNEGRGDDGLGWRFAEKAAALDLPGVDIEYRFQLQVEDAELVARYDQVIFADATLEHLEKGFDFAPGPWEGQNFFSSHKQSPETVLYLSKTLYQKLPKAFIMKICGTTWEMGVGLSETAQKNLNAAFELFQNRLATDTDRSF